MKRGEEQNDQEGARSDFLSEVPERFIVAAEELDGAVYEEFERYVEYLAACQPHESGMEPRHTLFDPAASQEAKRETLARLASFGTVDAYRTIERYVQDPDPALAQWSKVALYECRMRLEGELLEKPVGVISTGLGGAQHRLRYLVAIGLSCGPLHDAQRRRLESAWRTICERHDSALERVNFHPTHVILTLLVSIETAVGTVIDSGIAAVNDDTPILRQNYFVTNVAVPTDEEIQQILTEASRDETPE